MMIQFVQFLAFIVIRRAAWVDLVILIVEFVTKAYLFHRFNPIEEKRWTRKEKERSAHLTRVLEIIHKQNKNTIDVPPNIWVIPKSASLCP